MRWRLRLRGILFRLVFGLGLAAVFLALGFFLIDLSCGRHHIENYCAAFGMLWLEVHALCLAVGGMVAYGFRHEPGRLLRRATRTGIWAAVFSFIALALPLSGAAIFFNGPLGVVQGPVGAALVGIVLGGPLFLLAALWSGLYLWVSDRWSAS